MTLSDLERRAAKGRIFQADLINNPRTVWPSKTTKFGKITRGDGRIYTGQPRPHPMGQGPIAPNFRGSFMFLHWPFDEELPNLIVVTHIKSELVLGVRHIPTQMGGAPVFPNFGVLLYLWLHALKNYGELGVVKHMKRGLFLSVQPRLPSQVGVHVPNGRQLCAFSATYAYTVRPRTTKFGVVTHGEVVF